jgi:hypothetical protein
VRGDRVRAALAIVEFAADVVFGAREISPLRG